MEKKKQKDDDEPQFSRRFVKGEGGKYIIDKAWEFAKADDEDGFRETLHKLKLYDGMEAFEAGLQAFRDFCHELRQKGLL